ncbi:MAG: RsmE family RNA methyltransferase [Acidimicrobiales bacterium]
MSHIQQLRERPMVFVDDLESPALAPDDRHHLARSLRLRPGAALTVSDGAGRWRATRFGPDLEPDGEIVDEVRPQPELTIAFALVKGDRSDLVVQKLTELGIDRMVPLTSERSVVRWNADRAAKNLDRHGRIAREAAMQSRNPWLPTIEPLTELDAFLLATPTTVLADPAGEPPAAHLAAAGSSLAGHSEAGWSVAIGPEGGFSPTELDGRTKVALPGRILRTETAAITAAVLLVTGRGRGDS